MNNEQITIEPIEDSNIFTDRLRVEGGWIYRMSIRGSNQLSCVFVPETDHINS